MKHLKLSKRQEQEEQKEIDTIVARASDNLLLLHVSDQEKDSDDFPWDYLSPADRVRLTDLTGRTKEGWVRAYR